MQNETDRAWAAGIFDGEGWLGLETIRKYKRPAISVVNTDRKILEQLERIFGGSIYLNNHKDRPKSKPCWQWKISGKKILECLQMVEPYLISKREKAAELINHITGSKK